MAISSLVKKLRWLFTHPEFRKYPFSVLAGVVQWEYVRMRGESTVLELGVFRLRARPHDGFGRLVCYFGEAADEIFPFLQRYVQPGMTIVDVGANIGTHCLYSGTRAGSTGHIVAFEPDPTTAELLLENLAENGLSNVEVHEICLSDTPGRVELFLNRDSAKTSIVRPSDSPIELDAQRLDAIIEPGTVIDLLKIDVEGADYKVLEGARHIFEAAPPAIVIIEVTEQGSEIWNFLRSFGYRMCAYDATDDELQELEQPTFNCYAIHESVPLSHVGNDRYRLVKLVDVSHAV
ncbi:MAG TPA: FkbM family methyltransferase [Gemmatimonadaceae bacterium]|nr:FkbM family methyltransferase [Gemmatimonadaceae bacterium]